MELFNWKGGDGRWRWWPVTGCLSSRGRCGRWLSAAIGAMECRRWVGGAASDSQQADGTGGRELRAKEVRVCGVPAWEREGGGRGKKKKMGSGWRGPMRYKKASRKEPWRWAGERASCSPGSRSPRSLGVRPVVGPPAGNGQQTGKGGTGVWRDGKAAEAVGMTMDAAGTGQLDATSLGEKRYFATKLRANNLAERPQRRRRPGYLQIPTLPISSPLPSPSLSLSPACTAAVSVGGGAGQRHRQAHRAVDRCPLAGQCRDSTITVSTQARSANATPGRCANVV